MSEVCEPKGTPLNQFDFVVDAFSESIRPTLDKIVQNEIQPVSEREQKRLESLDIQLLNLSHPTFKCDSGFVTVCAGLEDLAKLFFQLMAYFQLGRCLI